ncbi:Fur family transcriptional regulator [Acetobacter sp.]|jgi:Fe2+ or Zn2+ uptake regulation protein|uniref:Fur family transcriptional regulator n=1 Tax=Acetobacter sp. TaxID=440 RepID=UPI0025C2551C|nr:Fur family transcriptional regulator [Acetobacter sp.]MCH4091976.1 Fur family transcriptional regulator [Acetobacter sp.]MCI1301104.1 Fur family transcriptional regulator [Acetobacter sp.]MCI1317297.1 Fur family transcriptional regulator [Acetobacter sp.]
METLLTPNHQRRRHVSGTAQIRPGKRASQTAIRQFESRCRESGIKITDHRSLIFHGIFQAGSRATALDIWKTIIGMVESHSPNIASIQRTLNILLQHGFIWREVGEDRIFRYSLAEIPQSEFPVLFVNQKTKKEITSKNENLKNEIRKFFQTKNIDINVVSITIICTDS